MQRIPFFLAYFLICANCFAQQYPFVHYTPKDGLISNQVRSIYQDSKGRLYFISINGLSIYDGARFINYSSKNGLENDIVNCVIEMGNDSLWIVTNVNKIQCLVKGKLKSLSLKEPPPLIDNLIQDEHGTVYAASEHGLYLFRDNRFIKLPFIDMNGRDIGTYIANIFPTGKYLLVARDNFMLNTEDKNILYLYDTAAKKIIAQTQNEIIFFIAKAPDGRIWASTNKNILALDTTELKKGKIVFQKLSPLYDKIEKSGLIFISFDQYGNCWLTDKVSVLKKLSSDGSLISFTTASGISSMDISSIVQDKEGTTWIANYSSGVDKLVHSNFSSSADVVGITAINSISNIDDKDQMIFYSPKNAKAALIENNHIRIFEVKDANKFDKLFATTKGLFGYTENSIYKLNISGNSIYTENIFMDTVDNLSGNPIADKNGNFILCGKLYLTAVADGKKIYRKKISYYADHASLDTAGNIWIVNRSGELIMYRPNADHPSNYLENEIIISKKIPGVLPRSIVLDKNNNIWIGTRNDGIHVFKLQQSNLIKQFHINSGLSDNFITQLACDADNNIWACTPAGLDRITVKNGVPVVENLTKQNNIYQKVDEVVLDKNNVAWGLLTNRIIKISPENRMTTGYVPQLMISMIKAGKDTVFENAGVSLSYKQNNLSFYFAATSFLDEKQTQYSYQLQGGNNDQWSEPSNNSNVSFIDLHPGNYTLNVKANFPADRYPQQTIQYKFSILPPWWQTWWFRSIAGLLVIGLFIIVFRFYVRRKLEKQMVVLEKQRAIEKERTRIATDMHDDLGAGLSRIKFLSETIGIKKQQQEPIEEDIDKIREYSHEMIDKMGEIVWALNEKNDTLSDLLSYTRAYTVEYLSQYGIDCHMEFPDNFPSVFVSGEFRRNIFLIIKEALHNVVKHSRATEVLLSIHVNHRLSIRLKDNGTGFDKNNLRSFSNGLSNMQSRAKEIGGELEIINSEGTLVSLVIPLRV